MKKYRLKQWYPSLPAELKIGDIVEFNGVDSIRLKIRARFEFIEYNWKFNGLELGCTQYWELIEEKEPLFITEDDVKLFSETSIEFYIVVNFIKYRSTISDFENQKELPHKVFYNESNADEYIWRNKPVFSYEDFIRWGNVPYERVIEQLAKERIEK